METVGAVLKSDFKMKTALSESKFAVKMKTVSRIEVYLENGNSSSGLNCVP
jgi:hypothetical protein